MLGLKNLAMLLSYFYYFFVHVKQKAHLRPEPDSKSPARLTTLTETAKGPSNQTAHCPRFTVEVFTLSLFIAKPQQGN